MDTPTEITEDLNMKNPSHKRWFDYFIYGPSKEALQPIQLWAKNNGFRTDNTHPDSKGESWCLCLKRMDYPSRLPEKELRAKAKEHGCEYDGWGTALGIH